MRQVLVDHTTVQCNDDMLCRSVYYVLLGIKIGVDLYLTYCRTVVSHLSLNTNL